MRVLQITAFSGWGCTGRIAQGIAENLIENGQEAAIAWGRTNTAPMTIQTIKIGNKYDQILHGVYTRLTDRCGFGSRLVTKQFIKQVEQYKPDIVHLHIVHGYYINLEILFAFLKEKNIPVVWTFHDCWAFTGHCPYFDFVGCDKWKTHCGNCKQKHHHPKSLFFDNSYNNYKRKKDIFTAIDNLTIVTPSEWLAGLVRQSFFNKKDVIVINNGINTNDFCYREGDIREKYSIPHNKRILLGVSSTWVQEKGINDFYQLQNKLDGNKYQVVLVGLNEKQLKELPKNIIGIKRTDSVEELAMLYSAADVFLNLTYEDNYPTTNLEAIACGTPVITYNTGGSVEIVQKTGYGKIVEKGNIDEVIKACKDITKTSNMIVDRMELDFKNTCENYFKLYRRILDKE